MSPKAKAKAKANANANEPTSEAAMCQEVATELGVVGDYKVYRASAENLNKTEIKQAQTAKDAAYEKAIEDGADEVDAIEFADAVHKQATFKFKLEKAHNKHLKKQVASADAPVGAAPAGAAAAPGPLAPPEALLFNASDMEPQIAGKALAYKDEITAAYERILRHKVFKDVVAQQPNPVRTEEAGDSGMQDRV